MPSRLRTIATTIAVGIAVAAAAPAAAPPQALAATATHARLGQGLVRVKSAYPFGETIARLKQDIAAKGIIVFTDIDQAKLAADAKISLRPSTLLVFGNPPLGTQFITSNPYAGIDWPVRLLVTEDDQGQVWMVYSDFHWIARRHGIKNRDAAFDMAAKVIASITGSVASK